MKTAFIVLFAAVTVSLPAQDEQKVFKPGKGSFVPEVNFSPFSNTPIRLSYLRLRYFLSNNFALRAGVNYVYKSEEPGSTETQKSLEFGFRPGIEWHFKGSDHLSPFIGADMEITNKSSKYQNSNGAAAISYIDQVWLNGTERGFNRFSINALAGLDFYVVPKFYLGIEFGISYQVLTLKRVEYTTTISIPDVPPSTSKNIAPAVNSFIRLGYVIN